MMFDVPAGVSPVTSSARWGHTSPVHPTVHTSPRRLNWMEIPFQTSHHQNDLKKKRERKKKIYMSAPCESRVCTSVEQPSQPSLSWSSLITQAANE